MKIFASLLLTLMMVTSMGQAAEPSFQLTSPAFADQDMMPVEYTCKGDNLSPELVWSNAPKGTESFAITCNDPDATKGNLFHWIIYNIPAKVNSLKKGIKKSETLSNGSSQGRNGKNRIGYDGPCPPTGKTHHYIFTLYALDSTLKIPPGSNLADFNKAIQGHVLKQTQLTGLFGVGEYQFTPTPINPGGPIIRP